MGNGNTRNFTSPEERKALISVSLQTPPFSSKNLDSTHAQTNPVRKKPKLSSSSSNPAFPPVPFAKQSVLHCSSYKTLADSSADTNLPVDLKMVGPGRSRIMKNLADIAERPMPDNSNRRHSTRLTPNAKKAPFRLLDEVDNDPQDSLPSTKAPTVSKARKSLRLMEEATCKDDSQQDPFFLMDEVDEEPLSTAPTVSHLTRKSMRLREEATNKSMNTMQVNEGPHVEPSQSLHNQDSGVGEGNQSNSESPLTIGSTSTSKRVRGCAINKTRKGKCTTDGKMIVEIDQLHDKIVGDWSSNCISEVGCVLKSLARFNVDGWPKQSQKTKDDIIANVRQLYEWEDSPSAQKAFEDLMSKKFRSEKGRLHTEFKKFPSKQAAMQNCPGHLLEEDWKYLCEQFDDPEYKIKCAKNAENRQKVKHQTRYGRKSASQRLHDKRKAGEEVNHIHMWGESHTGERSKATYEKMIESQKKNPEMSSAQIVIAECHSLPGDVHGKRVPQILISDAADTREEQERQKSEAATKLVAEMNDKVNEALSTCQNLKSSFSAQQEQIGNLTAQVGTMQQQITENFDKLSNHLTLLTRLANQK